MALSPNEISKFPALVFHKATSPDTGCEVVFNLDKDPVDNWRVIFSIDTTLYSLVNGVKTITVFTKEEFKNFFDNDYTPFKEDTQNKLSQIVHEEEYEQIGTTKGTQDDVSNTFFSRFMAIRNDYLDKKPRITSNWSKFGTNDPGSNSSGDMPSDVTLERYLLNYIDNRVKRIVNIDNYGLTDGTSEGTTYSFESNVKSWFNKMRTHYQNLITNAIAECKKYTDQECLATLPVGSMIPVYTKTSPSGFNSKFLLCDGSEIDSGTYSTLYNILPGGGSSQSHIGDLFLSKNTYSTSSGYQKMGMVQLGYYVDKFFREIDGSGPSFPIPLTEKTIINIINHYKTSSYSPVLPDNFPMETIMGNNFRSSSFGANNKVKGYSVVTDFNGSSHSFSPFGAVWCQMDFRDPYGQMEGNQVERVRHDDFYNIQIHFRSKYISGFHSYRRVQVVIGQSDSWTSVWENDLELDFYLDVSTDCGLLFFLEVGNRSTNEPVNKLFVFIPFDVIMGNKPYGNPEDVARVEWEQYNGQYGFVEVPAATPLYYTSQNYAGMNGVDTFVIELNLDNSTTADYLYMRIGGYHQGRTSLIESNLSDDSRCKPVLHPVLSYSGESPTSLWSMVHSAYRRWDGYVNYNYWYHTTTDKPLTDGWSISGYFNRFKVNTSSWLRILGLDKIYRTEQWKNFWDELIAACGAKTWETEGNGRNVYPRKGGVNLMALPETSSSSPSGFSSRTNFGGRANGANFGFKWRDRGEQYSYSSNSYPIRGCRTVLHLRESTDIYVAIDTDSNNTTQKHNYRGFILHENGAWKDLGHHLYTYATNGSQYNTNESSTLSNYNGNADWGWRWAWDGDSRAYESAGLCRIRIYREGEDEPFQDVMFCEFASNKSWEDGRGGATGDEGGVGDGFDLLAENEYILSAIRQPGNMYNNLVVVIDRIHNIYSDTTTPSNYMKADAWDCFDMAWFIDYCNNGNSLYSTGTPSKTLPNMQEDGIFLGGGSSSGDYVGWTIPELSGNDWTRGFYKYSLNGKGGGGNDDWGSRASNSVTLRDLTNYKNHIGDRLQPNHLACRWFIKHR